MFGSILGCKTAEPFPSATPKRVVEVTHQIFPAVVRLDVAQEIYSEGKRTLRRGIGSGVIMPVRCSAAYWTLVL